MARWSSGWLRGLVVAVALVVLVVGGSIAALGGSGGPRSNNPDAGTARSAVTQEPTSNNPDAGSHPGGSDPSYPRNGS